MSDKHNIDKLLQESFDNFSPEAPDVWQAVQQGVQAAQAAGAASSGTAVVAAKGASLAIKIIAGLAIGAAAVTGYVLYTPSQSEAPQNTTTESRSIETQPEDVVSTPNEVIAENSAIQQPISQPKSTEPSKRKQVKENNTTTTGKEKVTIDEPIKAEEKTVVDEPKIVTTSTPAGNKETSPTIAPVVSKNTKVEPVKADKPKQIEKAPYNPNAEDGEVYDKPIIPGSISPNSDGLNDRFEIIIENENVYSLIILNEKGETVFESKNKQQDWDGKHYKTGVLCSEGRYIYRLEYQYKGSDKMHRKSGTVELFF